MKRKLSDWGKMSDWEFTPKNLVLFNGKKNADAWWYADENYIEIFTSQQGSIGRIYPRSLKRFLKEKAVQR